MPKLRVVTGWLLIMAGSVCMAGCGDGGARQDNSTHVTQPANNDAGANAAKTERTPPSQHPSQDQEGMIYFFSNVQGQVNNRTVQTQILLYTEGMRAAAMPLCKDKKIQLHRQISKDEMGAILYQANDYGFYQWPTCPDYSQSSTLPDGNLSMISVTTSRGASRSAWTANDSRHMDAAATQRQQNFVRLREVILYFGSTSDVQVSTHVERR